jgi:hypothetical protein
MEPITAITTGLAVTNSAIQTGTAGLAWFEKIAPATFGMRRDNAEFRIFQNRVELAKKYAVYSQAVGPSNVDRVLPLSFMRPLTEAAELEEDDSLQGKWASLIVNAQNEKSGVDPRPAYVSTLRELSALDASILDRIYSDRNLTGSVSTDQLPSTVTAAPERREQTDPKRLSNEVLASLANLQRLGCLNFNESWSGEQSPFSISRTLYGQLFVRACTVLEAEIESADKKA